MKLKLLRFISAKDYTIGALFADDGFLCFTLEDEYREMKVKEETRIPEGTYQVTLRYSPSHSPKYGHKMLSLENVPNFTGILIHCGNTDKDTAGCILIGNVARWDGRIEESRLCYSRVYPMLAKTISGGESVTIEITSR